MLSFCNILFDFRKVIENSKELFFSKIQPGLNSSSDKVRLISLTVPESLINPFVLLICAIDVFYWSPTILNSPF